MTLKLWKTLQIEYELQGEFDAMRPLSISCRASLVAWLMSFHLLTFAPFKDEVTPTSRKI
jgi:hypothetical protein